MKYSQQQLITQIEAGERVKFLFFWGHQPPADGSISTTCFSQWYYAPFVVEGITYPTAEHWMMAAKARLFSDEENLAEIIAATSPAKAKELGRAVLNFSQTVWDQHKYQLVIDGNLHKFSQHPALQAFLLNTQNRVIVEASPRDQIWGIGLSKDNPRAEDPANWRGQNLLGFALMEVRDELSK